jgi:hypothetical protein
MDGVFGTDTARATPAVGVIVGKYGSQSERDPGVKPSCALRRHGLRTGTLSIAIAVPSAGGADTRILDRPRHQILASVAAVRGQNPIFFDFTYAGSAQ